jgi:hypothetical protein
MATATPKPMVLDGHEYREMTEAELEQRKLDQVIGEEITSVINAKKVARQAVLDKLGLTQNEAQALLG